MPISRDKKKEIVEKVSDIADGAQNVTFVNFKGVSVPETSEMRFALKNEGVHYTVAKKTLVRRALAEKKIEGELPDLEGEIAIAYGEDLLAPAREVYAFQKKFKDRVAIVGGIYDGAYKTQEEMLEIAKIPSLEVLRGQFVNVINSPIAGLAVALNAIAEKKA